MPIIATKSEKYFSKMLKTSDDGFLEFQLYRSDDGSLKKVSINENINFLCGIYPIYVKVFPSGTKAFIVSWDNIKILNLLNNSVIKTIPYNNTYGTKNVAISPDESTIIMTNSSISTSGYVSIFNINTDTLVSTITVQTNPTSVLITPDGTKAVIKNSTSYSFTFISLTGTPQVLNTISFTSNAEIDISNDYAVAINGNNAHVITLNGPISIIKTIACGTTTKSVAISPDATRAVVVNNGSNNASIISLSSDPNQIVNLININCGSSPQSVAITSDSQKAIIPNRNSSNATIISLPGTPSFLANVSCGTTPFDVSIGIQDSTRAFVISANSVTVVDLINYSPQIVQHGYQTTSISAYPDGSKAIVVDSNYNNITFINSDGTYLDYNNNPVHYNKILVTSDNSKALFLTFSEIKILNLLNKSKKPLIVSNNFSNPNQSITEMINVSYDGRFAIAKSKSPNNAYSTYNIVNLNSGEIVRTDYFGLQTINDVKISSRSSFALCTYSIYLVVVDMLNNYISNNVTFATSTVRKISIMENEKKAFVISYDSSTLEVVSLVGTPSVTETVSLGANPIAIEITKDQSKAVIICQNNTLKIVNISQSPVSLQTVSLPSGGAPSILRITNDSTTAIVSRQNSTILNFINLQNNQVSSSPFSITSDIEHPSSISISNDSKLAIIHRSTVDNSCKIIDLSTKNYYPKLDDFNSIPADNIAFNNLTGTPYVFAKKSLSVFAHTNLSTGLSQSVSTGIPTSEMSTANNKLIFSSTNYTSMEVFDLLDNFSKQTILFGTDKVTSHHSVGTKSVAILKPTSGLPKISVINLLDNSYQTQTLTGQTTLDLDRVKITPDCTKAIVKKGPTALEADQKYIDIYDISTGFPILLASDILVGSQPSHIFINSSSTLAFISVTNENKIAVVDLTSYTVKRYIPCVKPYLINGNEKKLIVASLTSGYTTIIDLKTYNSIKVTMSANNGCAISDDSKFVAVTDQNYIVLINLSNYATSRIGTMLFPAETTGVKNNVFYYNNKFIAMDAVNGKVYSIDPNKVIWASNKFYLNQRDPFFNFF